MPRLIGKRVMLREYRQEDLPFIRKWVNDANTVQYLSSIFWTPQTLANTQNFMDKMLAGDADACNFVIADANSEEYIGQLDIFKLDWKQRYGMVGVVIGSDKDRGSGLGTEALELLLKHAFETLGLERVELEVYMENTRARRCYEKAGFVMEGVKRHACFQNGAFADMGILSVLSGEWFAAHPRKG